MVLPLHVKDEPPGGLPVPAWRDLGSLACGQPNWSMNLRVEVIERTLGQSSGGGCQVVKSRDKYLSRREQTRGIGRIGAERSPVDHAVEVDAVVESGVGQVDKVAGGDGHPVHEDLRGERALWMDRRGKGSVLGPVAHAIWQKRDGSRQ